MKYICAEAVYIINTVVTDKKGTEKYKTKGRIASKRQRETKLPRGPENDHIKSRKKSILIFSQSQQKIFSLIEKVKMTFRKSINISSELSESNSK